MKNRFWELEGLRGVAAIIVAGYHYSLAFYGVAFLGDGSIFTVGHHLRIEEKMYGSPLSVFLSGTFAVAIFFVLSGFVLSIGFFQTGNLDIVKKLAAKRYLRLMIPVLVSVLFACTLMIVGLSRTEQAGAITNSGWLSTAWNFAPNYFDAIKSATTDIFYKSAGQYNNVLWTMVYEFAGSFLVFGFLALFAKAKWKNFLYVFLLVITFNSWFMAFVIGMILADLYANKKLQQKKRKLYLVMPLTIVALFLGGYPLFGVTGTAYQFIDFNSIDIHWRVICTVLGASLLVGLVLSVSQYASVFRSKLLSKLGKYTFSLYLVHLLVLYVFTCRVFLLFNQHLSIAYNKSVILSLIATVPVLWGATLLFEKYVDNKAIQLSSYVGGVILGTVRTPKLNRFVKNVSKKIYLVTKRSPFNVSK